MVNLMAGLLHAFVACVVVLGCAEVASAQDAEDVVARVGDAEVTLQEVEEAWHDNDAASRIRMLQQLYDTRRRSLDVVIGERLIDREAQTRGVSRDELLSAELPGRITPVADAEVDAIYERNTDRFGGRTLEQMRPEIRSILEQQRPSLAMHQYMGELRMMADDVVIMLEPPRQEILTLAGDPVRGPTDAAVAIVEFSDFQCPFCRRLTVTLDTLLAQYGDQLRFVFKDYPLPNHADAFKAAEAGNCANDQGRFWELHDEMFASQDALDVPSLKKYAAELGLDTEAFAECLDGNRYAADVERDLEIGQGHGVSSTPTIFINGRAVMGAAPLDVLDRIVREELAAAGL